MLKREVLEQKAQRWLTHLQGWRAKGGSLRTYAREQGLSEWEAYGWRRILRREHRWVDEVVVTATGSAAKGGAPYPAVKFARVKLRTETPTAPIATPMLLRVRLTNGRTVELALADSAQRVAVLAVLERAA